MVTEDRGYMTSLNMAIQGFEKNQRAGTQIWNESGAA